LDLNIGNIHMNKYASVRDYYRITLYLYSRSLHMIFNHIVDGAGHIAIGLSAPVSL